MIKDFHITPSWTDIPLPTGTDMPALCLSHVIFLFWVRTSHVVLHGVEIFVKIRVDSSA
jgi:hypothetical protein